MYMSVCPLSYTQFPFAHSMLYCCVSYVLCIVWGRKAFFLSKMNVSYKRALSFEIRIMFLKKSTFLNSNEKFFKAFNFFLVSHFFHFPARCVTWARRFYWLLLTLLAYHDPAMVQRLRGCSVSVMSRSRSPASALMNRSWSWGLLHNSGSEWWIQRRLPQYEKCPMWSSHQRVN